MISGPLIVAEALYHGLELEVYNGSALEINYPNSALVNAANEALNHGGGIAGNIVSKGGQIIQQESNEYRRKNGDLRVTENAVTGAGSLNFKCIIHAVGPRCNSQQSSALEKEQLVRTVFNALEVAQAYGISALVCPLISSGIFGFPMKDAAYCHLQAFILFAQTRDPASSLQKLCLAFFQDNELSCILDAMITPVNDVKFSTLVDLFRYYGNPLEQSCDIGFRFCSSCKKSVADNQEHFLCSCKHSCIFCILQYQFTHCLNCKQSFGIPSFSNILCRGCGTYTPDFHDCRAICIPCARKQDNKCLCGARI